jgi:hypothetical protein
MDDGLDGMGNDEEAEDYGVKIGNTLVRTKVPDSVWVFDIWARCHGSSVYADLDD